jgi:hypothetical protein
VLRLRGRGTENVNFNMKTKNKMYRTLIRLTNCITWQWQPGSIAIGDKAKVRRFKRRILKKIYSPFNINGIWHIRYSWGILYAA